MNENNENKISNFNIDIPIRISDINYGGHLGHAELIKITHQARLKFFSKYSLLESDLDGAGIIVKNLLINYKGEGFFDDILHISITMDNITKISCEFLYEITKNENLPVASVTETVLFMNYNSRRVVRVPQVILNLKDKAR